MIDVAIAGAGPAGIACAVALHRRCPSLRTLVLDRARFPRDKPCGGGLTGHASDALKALGLELGVPSLAAPRAVVRYGQCVRQVALPRPVRVIRRLEFDASLVAQARGMGIEVLEDAAVKGFSVERDGVSIGVGDRTLKARVLVGADGAGSLVRRHLVEVQERPIRLFRLELEGESPFGDAMLYDFSPMAQGLRGYLWIFPMPEGRLNVGLMHDPGHPLGGRELARLLAGQLAAHGLRLPRPARGWPAWGYRSAGRVAGERLLTVGDAAGIDALTGEGLAVGLAEGPVAAAAILAAFERGDFRFLHYGRSLRRATVGRELALDRWMARLLYRSGDPRRWLSLVLHDRQMLELYASRVCGGLVLADRKPALLAALGRHLLLGLAGARALERAAAGPEHQAKH